MCPEERVQTSETNDGEKKAIDVNLNLDGSDVVEFFASIRHFERAVYPELDLIYLALEGADNRIEAKATAAEHHVCD